MPSPEPEDQSSDDCVIHDHPVPPEEVRRYSTDRDPDAEQDIANYVHGQAQDEVVKHVEKIKSEYIMGEEYEIWDVTTDVNRWWVITNSTNLYSQKHFPSLDYTLSFHVGLMMRLYSRSEGADSSDPHPFDEVFRRRQQATERHERAVEVEDYQAVGMQLRECLLSLISAMQRRVELHPDTAKPKSADFVAWSTTLMDHLCPGGKNERLRQYLKATSEKTWHLVNHQTHDRSTGKTVSTIAIHACSTLIGHYNQILMREQSDKTEKCPICLSRNIRTHFDINIEPDGQYYNTCGQCDWSSHPGYLNKDVETSSSTVG